MEVDKNILTISHNNKKIPTLMMIHSNSLIKILIYEFVIVRNHLKNKIPYEKNIDKTFINQTKL